ncbi:MAG: hypothetical protein RRZ68_00450 [Oscillospiraceae bacterium]
MQNNKMKKILCILLAFTAIFCGCENTKGFLNKRINIEKLEPLKTTFSGEITIKIKDEQFKATIDFNKASSETLIYTYPESISGLTITKTQGESKLTYLGLSYKAQNNFMPQNFVLEIIDSVIETLSDKTLYKVKLIDSGILYTSNDKENGFELLRDAENMNIISINIPNSNILITFDTYESS